MFLKSALFAAASAAVRTKGNCDRDKYNRLRARRGPVRAIMAIAYKPLLTAFHMLSPDKAFSGLGKGYFDQVARKRSTTKLVQRLSNLGYDVKPIPKAPQPVKVRPSRVHFRSSHINFVVAPSCQSAKM